MANSTQYVFLYDVSGANKTTPVLKQVIQQPNAHVGLVWSPDGSNLYAAGGNDDAVYVYAKSGGSLTQTAKIALGHSATHGSKGVGLSVQPNASGLAISADGLTLVVANNFNDSISVIDTTTKTVRYEHDLRPYFANNEGTSGVAGGTYPLAVAMKGNGIGLCRRQPRPADRGGRYLLADRGPSDHAHRARRQPERPDLQRRADHAVCGAGQCRPGGGDRHRQQHGRHQDRRARAGRPRDRPTNRRGAPSRSRSSPDGKTLYAVNDGANSVAVIPLTGPTRQQGDRPDPDRLWPHDITFSADGTWMYIINGKSDTGPNPRPSHQQHGADHRPSSYPGYNAALNPSPTLPPPTPPSGLEPVPVPA